MEKLLFKKIEVWVLLLALVLGFVALVLYGAIVLHVAHGGTKTGAIGTVALSLAGIPKNVKEMISPRDFVTERITSAFDRSAYRPIAVESDDALDRIPIYWARQSNGPFQPAAMMFRLNEDGAEHLMILDRARQVVRQFPVTAGSLSGRHRPLLGNSNPWLLDDGTYIVHSHGSDGLYRKDLCGSVKWSAPGLYHHTYSIADGKIGILGLPKDDVTEKEQDLWNSSDILNIIDLETGKIERSVPLRDIARANADTFDPLMWHQWAKWVNENGVLSQDVVHLNKLEILSQELADDYPDFPAGAWMVSSRHFNLLFIVDPVTLKILWYSHGRTQAQHDPDFVGDNRIIVFNNSFPKNTDPRENPANFSSIRAFDFGTKLWSEPYNAVGVNGYSKLGGEVDSGRDGRLLISLTAQGRYLEVSSSGEVLSEFINVRDVGSVYWTKSAQYLTDEQFEIARDMICQPK